MAPPVAHAVFELNGATITLQTLAAVDRMFVRLLQGCPSPPPPARHACADLEKALFEVSQICGGQHFKVGKAVAFLKAIGLVNHASRLSKLSSRRRAEAHPDACFIEDFTKALAQVDLDDKRIASTVGMFQNHDDQVKDGENNQKMEQNEHKTKDGAQAAVAPLPGSPLADLKQKETAAGKASSCPAPPAKEAEIAAEELAEEIRKKMTPQDFLALALPDPQTASTKEPAKLVELVHKLMARTRQHFNKQFSGSCGDLAAPGHVSQQLDKQVHVWLAEVQSIRDRRMATGAQPCRAQTQA